MKQYFIIILLIFVSNNTLAMKRKRQISHNDSHLNKSIMEITDDILVDQAKEEQKIRSLGFAIGNQELNHQLVDNIIDCAPQHIKQLPRKLSNGCHFNRLLFLGEPGTGKSSLSKAIAIKSDRPYAFFQGPKFLDNYLHGTAKNLYNALGPLTKVDFPCAIIVDEINALTDRYYGKKKQGQDKETSKALWSILDDFAQNKYIFFMGTANDLKKLPLSLQTRFKGKIVKIPMPNQLARRKILSYHLSQNPILMQITKDLTFIQTLEKKCSRFSARDIESIIEKVVYYADENATKNDFEKAFKDFYESNKYLKKERIEALKKRIKKLWPYALGIVTLGTTIYIFQKTMRFQKEQAKKQQENFDKQEKLNKEAQEIQKRAHEGQIKSNNESWWLQAGGLLLTGLKLGYDIYKG